MTTRVRCVRVLILRGDPCSLSFSLSLSANHRNSPPLLSQPRRINNIRLDFKAKERVCESNDNRIRWPWEEYLPFAESRGGLIRVYRSAYFVPIANHSRAHGKFIYGRPSSISFSNFCDGFLESLYCRPTTTIVDFFFFYLFSREEIYLIFPFFFFRNMLEILGMFVSIIFVCLWECLSGLVPMKICHRFEANIFFPPDGFFHRTN